MSKRPRPSIEIECAYRYDRPYFLALAHIYRHDAALSLRYGFRKQARASMALAHRAITKARDIRLAAR